MGIKPLTVSDVPTVLTNGTFLNFWLSVGEKTVEEVVYLS